MSGGIEEMMKGLAKHLKIQKNDIIYSHNNMSTVWACKLIGNIIIQNKATEGYVFNV